MTSYETIKAFLQNTTFAVAGVSRNKQKMGNLIFNTLKKQHFVVYPINPNMEEVEGEKCYANANALPTANLSLIVVAPKAQSLQIVKDAVAKGIKNVWLQYGTYTDDALQYAQQQNINIVYKQCIMMYIDPTGIHKFHANINKFFGVYPK